MVDCGNDAEQPPPPPPPSASSSSSDKQQQQQQVDVDDNDGVPGCVKPCDSEPVPEPEAALPAPAPAPAAAGSGGGAKNDEDNVDGKTKRVYTCPRCYQEFHDETRYQKHCRKCSDT